MKKPEYKLVSKAKYIQKVADLADEIWHECYRKVPAAQLNELLRQKQSVEAIEEDIDQRDANYFLIQMDGREVGYFALTCPVGNHVRIVHLYIRAEWRGRGIGRDVVNYAARLALGEGRGRLLLEVFQRSQETATFFKRRGFCITREIPAAEAWQLPCFEMEKTL